MFKTILVPVDLAEPEFAQPAIDAAVAMARSTGAAVRLISVLQHLPAMMIEYLPADFDEAHLKEAETDLAKIVKAIGLEVGKVSSVVRTGPVHHEVLEEAMHCGADLIVMCSHDPGLRTYFLGSHAAQVVRHAHCSVLVVRTPHPDGA